MSEYWKRKEAYIAMRHGMTNFEQKESYRAEFQEEKIINLTGEELLYFSPTKRNWLIANSFAYLSIICGMVIGTTAAVYEFRSYLSGTNAAGNESASIVASILNAIQVQIYSVFYAKLSDYLTDRENHK
jgi:hypothetical protein